MGAHPLYASACVGYVGLVAHSQNIGIGMALQSREVTSGLGWGFSGTSGLQCRARARVGY